MFFSLRQVPTCYISPPCLSVREHVHPRKISLRVCAIYKMHGLLFEPPVLKWKWHLISHHTGPPHHGEKKTRILSNICPANTRVLKGTCFWRFLQLWYSTGSLCYIFRGPRLLCDDNNPHAAVKNATTHVTYSHLGGCVSIHPYVM